MQWSGAVIVAAVAHQSPRCGAVCRQGHRPRRGGRMRLPALTAVSGTAEWLRQLPKANTAASAPPMAQTRRCKPAPATALAAPVTRLRRGHQRQLSSSSTAPTPAPAPAPAPAPTSLQRLHLLRRLHLLQPTPAPAPTPARRCSDAAPALDTSTSTGTLRRQHQHRLLLPATAQLRMLSGRIELSSNPDASGRTRDLGDTWSISFPTRVNAGQARALRIYAGARAFDPPCWW